MKHLQLTKMVLRTSFTLLVTMLLLTSCAKVLVYKTYSADFGGVLLYHDDKNGIVYLESDSLPRNNHPVFNSYHAGIFETCDSSVFLNFESYSSYSKLNYSFDTTHSGIIDDGYLEIRFFDCKNRQLEGIQWTLKSKSSVFEIPSSNVEYFEFDSLNKNFLSELQLGDSIVVENRLFPNSFVLIVDQPYMNQSILNIQIDLPYFNFKENQQPFMNDTLKIDETKNNLVVTLSYPYSDINLAFPKDSGQVLTTKSKYEHQRMCRSIINGCD